MRSLLQRTKMVTCAVAVAGLLGFASIARADCPACSTVFLACGQSVLTTFQSCISAARTRAATQLCIGVARQGLSMCQGNFSTCIASCTPAN